MEQNLILAGVGGQGILTIAQAVSTAAMRRGWDVKQAEVHGMSQRGGAVYSHLRFADHSVQSELIPVGECDVVISMEPLEALRYVHYLRETGAVVANTAPLMNIPNYPPIEEVLDRICENCEHLLVDAPRLARAAGSFLTANAVLLGAACVYLELDSAELEPVLDEIFGRKGARTVEANRKAFRLGMAAAQVYRDGLHRGRSPRALRRWIGALPPERLTADATPPTAPCGPAMEEALLSAPEVHAAVQILENAVLQGREQLFEHEVYNLLEVVGAIAPPRHEFIPAGGEVTADTVARFSGAQVVLKVVSPDIVHKTEVGGVRFVPRKIETINRELSALVREHRKGGAAVDGVLLVEFVEREGIGFGQELFVGIRSTREFGPVIAAGLGGVDTEYLAYRLKPGVAVAKAPALETSAEEFFELFRKTAAYDGVAGRARGHRRVVSDGELLRCFRAFIALAGYFCVDRGDVGPHLSELEVNPFAFTHQRLVPLDGRGRLGEIGGVVPARPLDKVAEMLEPRTIAVAGVSGQRMNFGRIMLRNTLAAGFPPEHLYVLKPGDERIDGVRCVPSPGDVPEPIDLLVAAVSSNSVPQLMRQAIESGRVRSVILIPGGMGETEASESRRQEVQGLIRASRARPDRGPVVLGGNCLGIRSVPGRYDTFFVPSEKLPSRPGQPASRTALIAQSGAFAITRISNLETIRPSLAITIGNQLDLTASDLLRVVGRRDDIDVIGAYVEGFTEGDGLAFVRAVEEATIHGKVVIFYKAGRTAPGRSATAGHTASVAGDYDVCQAAVAQAGAIVVDTFKEFEQLVELASLFHDKTVGGRRIGVISNAGFEAVGMADAIQGARYELEMPPLGDAAKGRIRLILTTHQLDGLVNVGNPLDLNPMADEDVYEGCIRAMLDDPTIDALAVSIVPFTTELRTTPIELEGGDTLVERLSAMAGASRKPLLVVLDAGPPYEILARELRRKGVPVLPSCDQAIRSLGRYLCHRVQYPRERAVDPETRRLVDQLQSALQVAPAG